MREPILPTDVPQPLDHELLAWAAGFFDGEGTTIAKRDTRRPNYTQLDVSVPQTGRGAVPEVLLKFQRAMLGIGKIYERVDGYTWRAGGRVGAEVALALMWPWLGAVKREQARSAIEVVEAQYAAAIARRAPRYRPAYVAHAIGSEAVDASRIDRAWAAGFLDAEGWFGVTPLPPRKDGSVGLRLRVSASQHGEVGAPAEVLLRLRRALALGRIEQHGDADDFKWLAEGQLHVRAVLDAVRPWLGEVKTTQALTAIDAHHARRVRGDAERCIRGHLYDAVDLLPNGNLHRRCSTCDGPRVDADRVSDGRWRYAA